MNVSLSQPLPFHHDGKEGASEKKGAELEGELRGQDYTGVFSLGVNKKLHPLVHPSVSFGKSMHGAHPTSCTLLLH